MRANFGSFMADAWARSFLRHCRAELKGVLPDPRPSLRSIRKEAETIFRDCEPTLPDSQTRSLVASCSLVLAAYRHLSRGRDPAQAFEIVRRAVYRTYGRPMRFMARLWLRLARDPLKRLGRHWWRRQSARMYGAGMQFDQEDTADSVDLIVRRCAFHEFFAKHGEPELTRVFCGWDRNWMDVVDEPGRPVRTERPTTLSTGGDCCRFRIVRVTGERHEPGTDVILGDSPQKTAASRSTP